MKQPKVSYENYCKAFAGVFLKMARNAGTMHTCYIRSAIRDYCNSEGHRQRMFEDSIAEDSIGYRIASSLLRAGWTEDQILEYNREQQDRVDELCEDFIAVLENAGYERDPRFARHGNGLRYAWLMDGAPELSEHDVLDDDDDGEY